MQSTVTYKCPNCDAGLIFDAERQLLSCEFCLSTFTEEEIQNSSVAEEIEKRAKLDEEFASSVNQYYCQSCGAEIISEKNTVADFCYYCHNPVLLSHEVSGVMRPSKIIPFKFSKEDAQAEFIRYAKKKLFIPRDYFSSAQLEKISGVYYPFWVTDADTFSSMEGIGKHIRSWRQGDYRYTETKTYAVRRDGNIHFEDISTSAISTDDKDMLEGILPYPLDAYQDFSMPYLQGFVAKKRDIDREQLGEEVKGRMTGYASTILERTTSYPTFNVTSLGLDIHRAHWEYALLPVWIMTYKKKHKDGEKTYVYAMNGYTGKLYGEFPVSKWKLALLGVGLFVGVTLLSLFFGFNFFI